MGPPVHGVRLEVIGITDEPIAHWSNNLRVPTGTIGEVVVGGPMVTQRYYNREEATALAKIADDDAGTTLHRMGDLGYLDEQGRLWISTNGGMTDAARMSPVRGVSQDMGEEKIVLGLFFAADDNGTRNIAPRHEKQS